MTELGEPKSENALSFTISADFGHFDRTGGSAVNRTYSIPPRTTVMGMIAGLLGFERDSYYTALGTSNARIAVIPETKITRRTLGYLLPKTDSAYTGYPKNTSTLEVRKTEKFESSHSDRYSVEYIRNPEYTIYFTCSDEETYNELKQRLESHKFVYSPYLGISECIASIEYNGEVTLNEVQSKAVDSVVPSDLGTPANTANLERSARDMKKSGYSRSVTEYTTLFFNPNGESLKLTTPAKVYTDNENNLVFY